MYYLYIIYIIHFFSEIAETPDLEIVEETDGLHLGMGQSLERLDDSSHIDVPQNNLRKRADSLSVITVDTADLDCQLTRPDQEQIDKMIEEEKSKTGRVCIHRPERDYYGLLYSNLVQGPNLLSNQWLVN